MNKLIVYVLLAASISLLFLGCSKKNSDEACKHEVTMNLDKGNYDAVIASTCADPMSLGAAYLGKAGFDITTVINNFSSTGSNGSQTNKSTDFSTYMNALVPTVTTDTLTNLDFAESEYSSVTQTSDSYKDAQFYISIVDAVKGLSLLKTVIDSSDLGGLTTTCDENANSKPDEIDATSVAFLISDATPTAPVSIPASYNATIVVDHQNIHLISGTTSTALYRGLATQITGTGPNVGCPASNTYYKLLYATSAMPSGWAPVTTASGVPSCQGDDGKTWPCPILNPDGSPMDLVSALDQSLTSASNSINSSLTSTTSDVQTAITQIQTTACPNGPGTCTATDIANYLQTYGTTTN